MGSKNVERRASEIILKVPKFEELSFRQKLYSDPKTMDYGDQPFDFSRNKWITWFNKWIKNPEQRFYAYLVEKDSGAFVGDVNYHFDRQKNCFMIGIVESIEFRGRGFAQQGLKLLIEKAKSDGLKEVYNQFSRDRKSALHIHKKLGFIEICDKSAGSDVFLKCVL